LAGVLNPRYWLGFLKTPGTRWDFEKPLILARVSENPRYYCGFNLVRNCPISWHTIA